MEFAKHLYTVYMDDLEDNFPNGCIHLQVYLKNKDNMLILQLSKWLLKKWDKRNISKHRYRNLYFGV